MHDTNASSAAATRASTPQLAIPFATVERDIRAKLAEHRAWTDRLRYTPGVRYYHVAYEQLTGAAAENYLRSVVAFVLDKGVDIDLSSPTVSDFVRIERTIEGVGSCDAHGTSFATSEASLCGMWL